MDSSLILPLTAFAVLLVVIVVGLRWTGRVIADTREGETYRRAVEDLALRVDVSLGGIAAKVDGVRRHQVPPDGIAGDIEAAFDAVQRFAAEAGALEFPPPTTAFGMRMESELGRVERALEMIEHGCAILSTSRGYGRHTEGETAIKRGYLNLLHAREAFAEQAAEVIAARSGDLRARAHRRRG